jgi:hypothetical protein
MMAIDRSRTCGKSVVAACCAFFFLFASIGSVSPAVGADTWEMWPRKKPQPLQDLERKPAADPAMGTGNLEAQPPKPPEPIVEQKLPVPVVEQKPPMDAYLAPKTEEGAGEKTAGGKSYSKWVWVALAIAAGVGIGIAAGGGGSGGDSVVVNPGHQ